MSMWNDIFQTYLDTEYSGKKESLAESLPAELPDDDNAQQAVLLQFQIGPFTKKDLLLFLPFHERLTELEKLCTNTKKQVEDLEKRIEVLLAELEGTAGSET